jgi:hypothetical protein
MDAAACDAAWDCDSAPRPAPRGTSHVTACAGALGGRAQRAESASRPPALSGRKYEGDFQMGRRAGEGIATNANGRKFRGGVWENGQLIKEVKLILEKHAPTKSQYPSARPETRAACAVRPHCAAQCAMRALFSD